MLQLSSDMKNLTIKRIMAFGLDYLLGLTYGLLLYVVTIWIDPPVLTVLQGQLVGFLTLTLPVFLYFYGMEKSKYKGTIGKQLMGISVRSDRAGNKGILTRNILKFLPWEVAHTGVHWIMYFSHKQMDTPVWVWVLLVLPQVVLLLYIVSIFLCL